MELYTLTDFLDIGTISESLLMASYISLYEATQFCSYSQEYLSLRAKQGKLKAIKQGRNWVTTKEWLNEYIGRVEKFKQANGRVSSNASIFAVKNSFARVAIVSAVALVLFGSGVAYGKVGIDGMRNFSQSVASNIRGVAMRATKIPSIIQTHAVFVDAFVNAFAQEFHSNSSIAFTGAKGNVFYADLLISIPAENFRAGYPHVLRSFSEGRARWAGSVILSIPSIILSTPSVILSDNEESPSQQRRFFGEAPQNDTPRSPQNDTPRTLQNDTLRSLDARLAESVRSFSARNAQWAQGASASLRSLSLSLS